MDSKENIAKENEYMEDVTPLTLGRYRLIRLLAHGGMSEVFLARDEQDEQLYAIKVVKHEVTENYQHFCREMQILNLLQHAHILPILECQEESGLAYYVTPYIRHGSLKGRMASGRLSLEETGVILEQIGDALQFIHDCGLVHRDIKPANVLLDEDNYVWLADFGLAKEANTPHDLTNSEHVIGTPLYLAPELLEEPASPESDIYALGIMLYEMLTGTPPFQGQTPMAIYWKHVYELPPLPSEHNPLISPAIEQVILRAMAKQPEERFSSARELVEAYQQALLAPAVPLQPQEDFFEEETDAQRSLTPRRLKLSSPRVRVRSQHRHKLPLAVAMVMLAMLFMLGALSLAIQYQSYPSPPVSTGAQMISPPSLTPTAPPATHTSEANNQAAPINQPRERPQDRPQPHKPAPPHHGKPAPPHKSAPPAPPHHKKGHER
jgi:serine/threonine-protein kinase